MASDLKHIVEALAPITTPGALATQGLRDDEAVWTKLSETDATQLAALLSALGIGYDKLLDVMTAATLADADRLGSPRLRERWFDGVRLGAVAVATIVCLWILARVLGLFAVGVIAVRDLRPFEPITALDIRFRTGLLGRAPAGYEKDMLGKYVLHAIACGKAILPSDLSGQPLPAGLTGGIVRLAIKHSGNFEPWRLPLEVTLLLSPRHGYPDVGATVLPHAYILAAKDAGDVTLAWVAIDDTKAVQLAAAGSDIYAMVEMH